MWFILDKKKKKIGTMHDGTPFGLNLLSDTRSGQIENGYVTLQFDIPSNHEKASLLQNEGFIVYTNGQDGYELFRIKEITEAHGEDMRQTVYCETAATTELTGDRIRPKSFVSQSLSTVVSFLLLNTDWELGETYFDDLVSIEFTDYPTVLEALRATIEKFNAEIEFKIEFNGGKIARKVVNLYDKRGRDTKITFEYTHGLKGVTRKSDSNKIYTAMIGVGGEDANGRIISIADAQLQLEEPFEIVDDYIADLEALDEYGNDGKHIMGVYVDTDAQNPVDLANNTLAELKKSNKLAYTYEADLAFMESILDYEFMKVQEGDTIRIKDITFDPPLYLEARVLKKEDSLSQKDQGKVELGEYVVLKVQPIAALQSIQKKIQLQEKIWNNAAAKAQEALEAAKDQFQVEVQGVSQYKNGQGENTFKALLFQNGKEVDPDGTEGFIYVWSMYDPFNKRMFNLSKIGKTITVNTSEFDTRCNVVCVAYK
jgi:phage minor structural protein